MKSIKEIVLSKRFLCGIDVTNLPLLDYIWREKFRNYSSMCDIDSIHKNVLVLRPHNNVVKNEIFIKKDQIITEINKHFKRRFIKDIKFTV